MTKKSHNTEAWKTSIRIKINDKHYYIHPVYDLYGASRDGTIINIERKVSMKGHKHTNGYTQCCVRKRTSKTQKIYYVHRFVYECFHGIIPEGIVIDHVNDIRDDNRLSNLQMMTTQQNLKKSAKNRDYSFSAKSHENKRCVKAINTETNEETYFNSQYAVQQHLGINPGIVGMVCKGINNCKSGISKINNQRYTFEFVNKEDMPGDYKKSANIRPKRVFDDWHEREYICPRCDKVMKNRSKYYHNKRCY